MLKKKFQISQEEFVEFSKQTMIKQKFKVVFLTGLVLLVGSIALTYKRGWMEAIISSLLLFLVYFIVVFGVLLISTPLIAKKVYTKNKIGDFVFELEFNSNGIKQNKDIYYYSQFKKIVETKLAFHFYLLQKQIIVVSKRVFNEQELDDLRSLLLKSKDIKTLKLLSSNKKEK